MVIYLLEVECKACLSYLIPDQDGHGFQLKTVLKVNVQKIGTTTKSPKISKTQVIQKLLIMVSEALKGGL